MERHGWLESLLDRMGDWPTRRTVVVSLCALVLLLAAMTSYARFNALLRSYHGAGHVAFGLTAATSVILLPDVRAEHIREAVDTWKSYTSVALQSQPWGGAVRFPVIVTLAIDSFLLVPSYALLLLLLIAATRWKLSQPDEQKAIRGTAERAASEAADRQSESIAPGMTVEQPAPRVVIRHLEWSRRAAVAALIAGGANEGQNILAGFAILQSVPPWLAWVLSVVVWVKWLALAAALVYVLSAGLLLLHHGGDERTTWSRLSTVWRTARAVRVPLLVLAVFALALWQGDQGADIIRRWANDPQQGFTTIALLILFAAVLWWMSRWLLAAEYEDEAIPGGDTIWQLLAPAALAYGAGATAFWSASLDSGLARILWPLVFLVVGVALIWVPPIRAWIRSTGSGRRLAWLLVAGLGLVLLLALALHTGDWKVFIPVGLVLAIAALSVLLRGMPLSGLAEDLAGPLERKGWTDYLPLVLASTAVLLLGLAVLAVAVDVALYTWLFRGREADQARRLAFFGVILLPVAVPLVAVFAVGRFRRLGTLGKQPSPRARASTLLGALALWLIALLVLSARIRAVHDLAPQFGGGAGVVLIALGLMTMVGSSLVLLCDRYIGGSVRVFRLLHLRRTPVVTFVALWFLVPSYIFPRADTAHDVRPRWVDASGNLLSVTPALADRIPLQGDRQTTLGRAFDEWRRARCLMPGQNPHMSGTAAGKPTVPLILVASSGGGVRSAAWTAMVMERAFGYQEHALPNCSATSSATAAPLARWLFAVSGVSGGSAGFATYAAEWDRQVHQHTSPSGSISDRFEDDSIAATLAWMLFTETPWTLMRYPLHRDRARVLEETWERNWWGASTDGQPLLFQLQHGDPWLPLLVFNGTSVESGCRFNASIVKTNGRDRDETSTRCLAPLSLQVHPGTDLGTTVDLVDFLCERADRKAWEDISLSTAALLSGRFPVISPSGHLQQCTVPSPTPGPLSPTGAPTPVAPHATPETYVVDGGYHEASAAATIADVWNAVAPLVEANNSDPNAPAYIVPYMMQIDNGYSEPAGPSEVPYTPQLLVPLVTLRGASLAANQERARETAQVLFKHRFFVAERRERGGQSRVCYFASGNRYALFALRPHPGPSAPLGWTLSGIAIDDLKYQLDHPLVSESSGEQVENNPLKTVRQWNNPTLQSEACDKTPPNQ